MNFQTIFFQGKRNADLLDALHTEKKVVKISMPVASVCGRENIMRCKT